MQDLGKKSYPSENQIREFWEWCGFTYEEHNTKYEHWWSWKSLDNSYSGCENPTVDLNNLFKYAWGKAVDKLFATGKYVTKEVAIRKLFLIWQRYLFKGFVIEDALFWAIREVIKKWQKFRNH